MGRKKARKPRKSKRGRKKIKKANYRKRLFQRGGSFFGFLDAVSKGASKPGPKAVWRDGIHRMGF